MVVADNINKVKSTLTSGVELVAVSKYQPSSALKEAYDAGQRIFGESHVQELIGKYEELPKDIKWHFIGHLQTNKVKYMASFINLIHSVDSLKLLREIDKQAQKTGRVIDCLLQLHVAQEETKFGFSSAELLALLNSDDWRGLKGVRIVGLMAMASNTDDDTQVESEFASVKSLFDHLKTTIFKEDSYFNELSMGMSGDYLVAIKHGSTLVRVGSMIFGNRIYN